MANSKKQILFIDDTKIRQFISIDQRFTATKELSFAPGILENGYPKDSSQLRYFIKKMVANGNLDVNLQELSIFLSSSEIVTRSVLIPDLKEEEVRSFVTNEINEIFIQDIDQYEWESIQVEKPNDSLEKNLFISIIPKDLKKAWEEMLRDFSIKKLTIIPLSLVISGYLGDKEGTEVWEIGHRLWGFHRFGNKEFYSKNFQAESMGRLSEKYKLSNQDYHHLMIGKSDERILNFSKEDFQKEFAQSLYNDQEGIRSLSSGFTGESKKIIFGDLAEEIGADTITNTVEGFEGKEFLPIQEVIQNFMENKKKDMVTKEEPQKNGKKLPLNGLTIILILGLLTILGAFLYGKNLEAKNAELQAQLSDSSNSSSTTYEEVGASQEIQGDVDLSMKINSINASKPEEINVSSIQYANGSIEINGQAQDRAPLDKWIGDLKSMGMGEIQEQPSSTIDGVEYFRFTIVDGSTEASNDVINGNANEGVNNEQ
ncbi:hypothetical protein LQU94_02965 [Peptoniphilus sp. KCTC 25270]|uniref:hypothetical protein n=1 Tax=Peptoniphilus sp. KCTC 25270 TaxID=2897414 RepID=UPI001E421A5B|nr:hypothetical protein [Peptoniphilus sp. KCTC 25270]MCD1147075.1 hypothetical protein [Peptoniphilus sp. KCTC 25270]